MDVNELSFDETMLKKFRVDKINFEDCINECSNDDSKFGMSRIDDNSNDESNPDESNIDETNIDENNTDENNTDENNIDENRVDESSIPMSCEVTVGTKPDPQPSDYDLVVDSLMKEIPGIYKWHHLEQREHQKHNYIDNELYNMINDIEGNPIPCPAEQIIIPCDDVILNRDFYLSTDRPQ